MILNATCPACGMDTIPVVVEWERGERRTWTYPGSPGRWLAQVQHFTCPDCGVVLTGIDCDAVEREAKQLAEHLSQEAGPMIPPSSPARTP